MTWMWVSVATVVGVLGLLLAARWFRRWLDKQVDKLLGEL